MAVRAEPHALISLSNVSVAYEGTRVLHGLTWHLHPGQHWAVVGPNGSGKSTFLRLMRGEIWPDPVGGGTRTYGFEGQPTQSPIGMRRHIAMVGAEQQTRYARTEWDLKVWQVVHTGLADTDLIYRAPTDEERARVDACLEAFGLIAHRDALFRALSQGMLRKVLVARALIRAPRLLLCDEIGVGLDPDARQALYAEIERVAQAETQVLMVSHRREELIPSITHELELRAGRVHFSGPIATAKQQCSKPGPALTPSDLREAHATPLIEICNADVAVDAGRLVVLRNIDWTVRAGEHWFVTGPNGAGKTTLLRLLLGELDVNRSGRIVRHGDLAQDNIWELKKRIGYVSPELQTRYSENLAARDVIATGFNATVGWLQPINARQRERADELLALFGLEALADRGILNMSYGQARKVLIARALANRPSLLLLDEAFDGLDAGFRSEITGALRAIAHETTMIMVSHYGEDRMTFLNRHLRLEQGRIVTTRKPQHEPAI